MAGPPWREYLQDLGLREGASDEEAFAFYGKLPPAKRVEAYRRTGALAADDFCVTERPAGAAVRLTDGEP